MNLHPARLDFIPCHTRNKPLSEFHTILNSNCTPTGRKSIPQHTNSTPSSLQTHRIYTSNIKTYTLHRQHNTNPTQCDAISTPQQQDSIPCVAKCTPQESTTASGIARGTQEHTWAHRDTHTHGSAGTHRRHTGTHRTTQGRTHRGTQAHGDPRGNKHT
jgi:hypothetical protein